MGKAPKRSLHEPVHILQRAPESKERAARARSGASAARKLHAPESKERAPVPAPGASADGGGRQSPKNELHAAHAGSRSARPGEQRAPESTERAARRPRSRSERGRGNSESKERAARPSALAPDIVVVAAGAKNALYTPIQGIPMNGTNLAPVLGSVLVMLSRRSPILRLGVTLRVA